MKQPKPYKRIIRPLSMPDGYAYGYNTEQTYIADDRYANDRYEIIRAYHVLEKDFLDLLKYIEPANANLATYSYKTYELLLRAYTEFESNAKKILHANNYLKQSNLNITDYYKINAATRLNEYKIFVNVWASGKKELNPFGQWNNGHSLSWYQGYNDVKHNRKDEFSKASLENAVNALGAVFCIIFSQFHNFIFAQFSPNMGYHIDDATREISSLNDSLFSIILPNTWTIEEQYDFDWPGLRTTAEPFQIFPF